MKTPEQVGIVSTVTLVFFLMITIINLSILKDYDWYEETKDIQITNVNYTWGFVNTVNSTSSDTIYTVFCEPDIKLGINQTENWHSTDIKVRCFNDQPDPNKEIIFAEVTYERID